MPCANMFYIAAVNELYSVVTRETKAPKQTQKLVSSAFALLFTEISVVWVTEISVKSSAKADETSLSGISSLIQQC